MIFNSIWFTLTLFTVINGDPGNNTFPQNFIFGVGTSAYQIEGAWNESGKGQSVWDYYLHENPKLVRDGTNGDVACDSYHKYKDDVKLLKDLGVDFYRFSIAWTRIIPSGYESDGISQDGIKYYSDLIDELKANKIEPYVTIFHWDTPMVLEKEGGWLNRSIIDNYVSYARLLFNLYGNRVKFWLTFNEFSQFCQQGYSSGQKAPFKTLLGVGGYLCTHHALIAHAKTYKMYVDEFKKTQKGFIALSVDSAWQEPKTDSFFDTLAADEQLIFTYSYYLHPIVFGDYPAGMKTKIGFKSFFQGYHKSRLPEFSNEELKLLKGSYDFIGLNHYTTALCTWSTKKFPVPSEFDDCGVAQSQDPSWKISAALWLAEVPWGFRKLLVWIKENLNNPPLLITENGWAMSASNLKDDDRISYHKQYLAEILKAIYEDGCNVIGYTAWTLIDNFEWTVGYSVNYGLVQVDFNSPNRTRTPKNSFYVYQGIIKSKTVNN